MVADAHRARVADALLERRPRGDELPGDGALFSRFVEALRQIESWPCDNAAAVVTGRAEALHGDAARRFPWASVTKVAAAVAMLVAAEEGIVDLDEPAGPPGSTFRHLLAHASGLPFEAGAPIAQPGRRRIYSNYGFEVAAEPHPGAAFDRRRRGWLGLRTRVELRHEGAPLPGFRC